MFNGLNIVLGVILVMLWGTAAWLWHYRNRADELNQLIPLMSKYRKGRLHPLFGSRKDVIGLGGVFFGIGILIFVLLLK